MALRADERRDKLRDAKTEGEGLGKVTSGALLKGDTRSHPEHDG